MYVFSVQYSCAVVSVFWLWREIVLKMRTRFYKKILLGYFIMIQQPMCVFIRPNTFLLCIFLFCIFLFTAQIRTLKFKSEYYLRINRKLCQKCKHPQSHLDFLKNAYPVSLFKTDKSKRYASGFGGNEKRTKFGFKNFLGLSLI